MNKPHLGYVASKIEPSIEQVFIGKNGLDLTDNQFNAKLFAARKISEHVVDNSKLSDRQNSIFLVYLLQLLSIKGY